MTSGYFGVKLILERCVIEVNSPAEFARCLLAAVRRMACGNERTV